MAGAYSKPFNISVFWYYIKQIMNVFIRAMVRIFSFGERWNVPFNSAVASLNGTFHLSPHENILTIALINIHYLYSVLLKYSMTTAIFVLVLLEQQTTCRKCVHRCVNIAQQSLKHNLDVFYLF